MTEIKDITDYGYVNDILHKFELDLGTIIREPFYSETRTEVGAFCLGEEFADKRDSYSLSGYKFYENDEYFGAILFENTTSGIYNKFYAIFDENGELVHYESGYGKNYWGFSKEKVENEITSFIANGNCKITFDKDAIEFVIIAKSKYGIDFVGKVRRFQNHIEIDWVIEPFNDEERIEHLKEYEINVEDLPDTFVSLVISKDAFLQVKKDDEDYMSPGPNECIYGSRKSNRRGFASEYHKWFSKLLSTDYEYKYAVDFSLKPDARVLSLKTPKDIETLSSIYPGEVFCLDIVSLGGEFGHHCAFIDWEALQKDYDAIFVSGYIPKDWHIPGIVVLNKSAIDKYIIYEIEKFLEKY